MFVTIEPSHTFDWPEYDSWDEYNRVISRKFVEEWTGGPILEELLDPVPDVDLGSVWMADAIKRPPEGGIDDQTREEEFARCMTYLREEIEHVDPDVIIGLGNTLACVPSPRSVLTVPISPGLVNFSPLLDYWSPLRLSTTAEQRVCVF